MYASYCRLQVEEKQQEENVVIKILILCTLMYNYGEIIFTAITKNYCIKERRKRNRINICYFVCKQWHTGILQLNESLLQFIVHIKCFKGLHLALSEIEKSFEFICLHMHEGKLIFNFVICCFSWAIAFLCICEGQNQ